MNHGKHENQCQEIWPPCRHHGIIKTMFRHDHGIAWQTCYSNPVTAPHVKIFRRSAYQDQLLNKKDQRFQG